MNGGEAMNDLTAFLLVRSAEDAEKARRALAETEVPEYWDLRVVATLALADHPLGVLLSVAAQNPTKVLAECEAKRRIVERMAGEVANDPHLCRCFSCLTLLDLASVYVDHPDYRNEWKA